MICRPLLFALLQSGAVSALLDAHITVTVISSLTIHPHDLRDLSARAVTVGSECALAESVLNACVSSGLVAQGVPAASQQACLCCADNAAIAGEYSSCATYLAKESPTETSLLSAIATLYGVCATGATCAAPTTTQPPLPAECTSVANIYQTCAEGLPELEQSGGPKLAQCLCYDERGRFNTQFDDYARSCAPWVSSAAPEDVKTIASFATFCAAQNSATAAVPTTTQAPTLPTAAPTGPVKTTSTGLAVAGVAPGGLALGLMGLVMLL